MPPPATAETVPLQLPVQDSGVEKATTVFCEGCSTVTLRVMVQPLASVMVQVYTPAPRLLAVAPEPPLGDQE